MQDNTETRNVTPAQAVRLYDNIGKRGDQNWYAWIDLGRWITERRKIATAKANASRGPKYAPILEKQLRQFYPIFKKLSDNGTLAWIDKCLENYTEIEAWRTRQDQSQRSSNPRNVYQAWADSHRSDIDWTDDADNDQDQDTSPTSKKLFGKGHNSEKELLAEIERLKERVDQQSMTIYPDHNAERIYRNLVEVVGAGLQAAELCRKTASQLEAIARRFLEPQFQEHQQ